jgi:hypothetical protein
MRVPWPTRGCCTMKKKFRLHSASRPGHFTSGKKDAGANLAADWVGYKASLGTVTKMRICASVGNRMNTASIRGQSTNMGRLRCLSESCVWICSKFSVPQTPNSTERLEKIVVAHRLKKLTAIRETQMSITASVRTHYKSLSRTKWTPFMFSIASF